MIDLFRSISSVSVGTLTPPQWPYVQRSILRNIEKVQLYYRNYPQYVRAEHLLVRLLHSIAIPASLPLDRFYAAVDANALRLASIHQMTSEVSKGKVHTGVFYGNLNPEIIIATDDWFDYQKVNDNWQTVCAVRPLLHAVEDFEIRLANGRSRTGNTRQPSIILINIPMLAVQYRAFVLANVGKALLGQAQTITQFISSYVLPNMLTAQTELALMNRLIRLSGYARTPIPEDTGPKHSFFLPKYDTVIDAALYKTLEHIDKSPLTFDVMLKTIPSFLGETLYSSLLMPDLMPNRQLDWALTYARLAYMDFLISLTKGETRSKNQITINALLLGLRRNDVLRVMQDVLPATMYEDTQVRIQSILKASSRTYI